METIGGMNMEEVKGIVTVASLRIRKDVSTDSEVIAYAKKGEELVVEAHSSEWLSVTNSAGVTGFVMAQYVTVG